MIGHPTTSARRIGPMLRKLRNDRGLTIARLAEQAGLSKGYISQIESGHKQPHWSTLMRLVHLLDERLCHLLAADGEEGARQVAKSEAKRPDDPTVEEEEVVVQFGVDRADCIPLAGNLPDEWGRVAGADEQGYTWILTPDPEARIVSEVLRVRIPAHAPWTPDRLQFAAPVVAYGLEGTTLLEVGRLDRDEFVLSAGSLLSYDGLHRLRNHTDTPSELLLIFTPPGV